MKVGDCFLYKQAACLTALFGIGNLPWIFFSRPTHPHANTHSICYRQVYFCSCPCFLKRTYGPTTQTIQMSMHIAVIWRASIIEMWLMLLTVFDNTSLHLFRVLFRNSLVGLFVNVKTKACMRIRICNVCTITIGTISAYQNSIDDVIVLSSQTRNLWNKIIQSRKQ